MMTKYERQNAEEMRDKLKKILPDLKLADRHAQYRIKTGKLAREDYRSYIEAEAREAAKARKSGEAENRPPAEGERVMFEIVLHVCETRRGRSNYFGCDYRQVQPCPHCVAEAGMEIYLQIKHLLRRARKEKKNAIAR